MLRFFQDQQKIKKHIIGMTQYYIHNFQDPFSPKYVSTYDVSSCVVVLLKNITESNLCSFFWMAHKKFKIEGSLESLREGCDQRMTIACDQKEMYVRKVTFKKGAIVACELYPIDSQLLSNNNFRNIVCVDKMDYERLKTKTDNFYTALNKLYHHIVFIYIIIISVMRND